METVLGISIVFVLVLVAMCQDLRQIPRVVCGVAMIVGINLVFYVSFVFLLLTMRWYDYALLLIMVGLIFLWFRRRLNQVSTDDTNQFLRKILREKRKQVERETGMSWDEGCRQWKQELAKRRKEKKK